MYRSSYHLVPASSGSIALREVAGNPLLLGYALSWPLNNATEALDAKPLNKKVQGTSQYRSDAEPAGS